MAEAKIDLVGLNALKLELTLQSHLSSSNSSMVERSVGSTAKSVVAWCLYEYCNVLPV